MKMKYGKGELEIIIPHECFSGLIQSKPKDASLREAEVIEAALLNPIGSSRLRDIVKPGESVCIIISDITRAWQKMDQYLPYIVEELNKAGTQDKNITFLCATGSHRPQTGEEHKLLLGDKLAGRFEITEHDCRDKESMVCLGKTSFGTPVIVNRMAVESDHVILTGAIVFHDLAGWGGGKKSILPGICAYESIMANHALSLNPKIGRGLNPLVRCGNADSNPVHLDMLEAAAFVKPSFLFNVIIDESGNISKAVAGDYIRAHEAGRKIVDEADSCYLEQQADLVVVSAGGYPADINLYQASKALINAKGAVKRGGSIVLLAECTEGIGGEGVQMIIEEFDNKYSREEALRDSFTVEKYTGYLITEIAEEYNVSMVSSLDKKLLNKAGIRKVSDVEEAFCIAGEIKGDKPKTYLMPNGAKTFVRFLWDSPEDF